MSGARVNWVVGGPIVALFLIGGIVFWIAMPEVLIGQIWVAVSVFLLLVYGLVSAAGRRRARLMREGVPGTATVLGVEQTGVYVNEQPQVRLRLLVSAPGAEPYEVTRSEVVPVIALGALSGGRLNVVVDPDDPENVVVDWSVVAAPMTLSMPDGRVVPVDRPAARQEVAAVLREHGVGLSGEVSVRDNPAARRAVWEVLERHGYDVDGQTGGPRRTAAADAERSPADALAELAKMRERKLITDAEYELKKREILSDL